MRKIIVVLVLMLFGFIQAQELNCVVSVNSERVTANTQQVFKTLETSLNDFVNKTKWSSQNFNQNERIECSMFINVSEVDNTTFTATIQIQSSRPVYNSIYSTPIFNYNDKDFTFKYVEFESLNFNPNSFDSNLVSVVAFYSYIIMALDADSFESLKGNRYLEMAQNVMSVAQTGGYKGWSQTDGLQNRYYLISDLLSNTFNPIRQAYFEYHANGLDKMADDVKLGKENLKTALLNLSVIHSVRPNAFLTRVFFDAKSDEIADIFSDGPSIQTTELVDKLNRLSPLNASKWSTIKF
ncbi:DUF4835 family protein [Flavobacterium sp.]|jgi:hypothetical protein|uniref:type IX secretion system protein PorD n=1 Tax=Flavobacterium sp. TaxID=239 RepID=UPI0037BE88D6